MFYLFFSSEFCLCCSHPQNHVQYFICSALLFLFVFKLAKKDQQFFILLFISGDFICILVNFKNVLYFCLLCLFFYFAEYIFCLLFFIMIFVCILVCLNYLSFILFVIHFPIYFIEVRKKHNIFYPFFFIFTCILVVPTNISSYFYLLY